jgi:hypothetical protein
VWGFPRSIGLALRRTVWSVVAQAMGFLSGRSAGMSEQHCNTPASTLLRGQGPRSRRLSGWPRAVTFSRSAAGIAGGVDRCGGGVCAAAGPAGSKSNGRAIGLVLAIADGVACRELLCAERRRPTQPRGAVPGLVAVILAVPLALATVSLAGAQHSEWPR